jgi:signal transduction histidine kinase/DNA-binding response OmpR family regulator
MATILIVDDVAANREFLSTLLGYRGHTLYEACDGAEALACARAMRPDLVITDVLMPTIDGYEFVRQLRADPLIAATVVVFCTADYRERDAQRLARACGVSHVLIKPCEPELVLRTVELALGLATESHARMPPPEFDREHLRLVTDKLSGKTTELEAVNRRLAAVIDISLELAAEPDPRQLLESVCHSARELLGARYCVIAASPEPAAAALPAHFFTSGIDSTALGTPTLREGVLGATFSERRPRRLRALDDEPLQLGLPPGFPVVRSLLAAPVSSLTRPYGWLCCGDKIGAAEFTDEDERLANIVGAQVGRMYENLTLYAEAQSQRAALAKEAAQRRQAQVRLEAQLGRLELLHRITRAIGERQDLRSIFQVVVRSLEDRLPIDFGCICLYDPADRTLIVNSVGVRNVDLGESLALVESGRIAIESNGLARCVRGELIHEPDTELAPVGFSRCLASAGLRAAVYAPLLAESKVFGVLIAARRRAQSFSSSDCEFLRQLSEHVALATHQAQLYSALQQAYEDLRQSQQAIMQQERLRALGQMASGVAHDINNAISPVALYTEWLLEQEPNLSERARHRIASIRRAIDDVAQTVSRMREFYRPRETPTESVPVALNPLVEQVVEYTRARWYDVPQQQGVVIDLHRELEPDLPHVLGTEPEIRDALTNLIFNAVDAMPTGGSLTIRTRASMDAGTAKARSVYLDVTDTGIGMDEETRRRCLEPFFTTKGERGTGLGLAMVYGMAQRHGIETEIDSAPGKGTTMRLVFAAPARQTIITRPEIASIPRRALAILLVDDDPLVLESMDATLRADGHAIAAVDGGQAGIEAIMSAAKRNAPFDVVITDLGMPYVDGRKVAATVKATSPSTAVILLTGWGRRMADDNELPPHVDCVLAKPPKLAELRGALAQFAPK